MLKIKTDLNKDLNKDLGKPVLVKETANGKLYKQKVNIRFSIDDCCKDKKQVNKKN